MSETINISGDTFEVNLTGHCEAGEWRMIQAGNQLISIVPKDVGEARLKEVMSDEYKEYEWGWYYARSNEAYCIVLRGHSTAEFEAILNTM